MKKNKAVIAGATGFIGSALVNGLADKMEIIELKREGKGGTGDLASPNIHASIPKGDVLFHVAGVISGRGETGGIKNAYGQNINITLNLLEMARQAGIPKIVFASSYVYGQPQKLPIGESHPIRALTPYMHSKIISEELLKAYSQWAGINVVSLRLFNPYGPHQKQGMVIADILSQLDQPEIVLGDPRPKRDFVYIDDVVSAFEKAAHLDLKGFEAVNIGSGTSASIEVVAGLIKNISATQSKFSFRKQKRPVDIKDVIADVTKAKALLGWVPKTSLKEGLSHIIYQNELSKPKRHLLV